MSIKEKSSFNKREYEYTSPDGDLWNLVFVEHAGRSYVKFGKEGEDIEKSPVWDAKMILDFADIIDGIMHKRKKKISSGGRPGGLHRPKVVDYRSGSPEVIQSNVEETMRQEPSPTAPVESFLPKLPKKENWVHDQTEHFNTGGLSAMSQDEAIDTPTEFKGSVADRKDLKPHKSYKKIGNSGKGFKRTGAGDLI